MVYRKGSVVKATVTCVEPYGAFVKLEENYVGLIHISEISNGFVKNINDFIKIGDNINVKIIGIDKNSKHLKLSKKIVDPNAVKVKVKREIVETPHGFTTLKTNLPVWINQKLKKMENEEITLDK